MTLDLHDLLRAQADALADRVRAGLSTEPGGDHRRPWRRSGALAASIGVAATPDGFVVGAASDVALAQELGSQHTPPRPFLAPEAAAAAPEIAQAVGAAAAAQIEVLFGRR